MMRATLCLFFAIFGASAAMAQSVPNGTIIQGEVWTPSQWNNAWASKTDLSAYASVSNNAALKALTAPVTGALTAAYRAGFSAAGDGGAALYNYSSSACSLNSGAGDNGSQVAPASGGGCWLIAPQAAGYDIRIWGASTAGDIAPFVQISYNANVGCILIPAGIWPWQSAVTMTAQVPCFIGAGWNESVQSGAFNAADNTGTWISISSTSFNPVTITSVTGQGGTPGFSKMAFYEAQPTPGTGWTPTAYPYIFTLNGNLGRVDFDQLMFYNSTHCISFFASARAHVTNIYGQPVGTCLQFDDQTDISLLQNVEFWPFWTNNSVVAEYNMASVDPILYLRSDSPTISNVFAFGYHSAIAFGQSSSGVTTGAQIPNLEADSDKYSFWIKPSTTGVQLQIGSLRTAGEDWTTNTPIASSEGYRDEGTNSVVSISNLDCFYAGANCVDITSGGRVDIGNANLWSYNESNVSAVGMQAGASGWISLANPPDIVNPYASAPAIPATSLGGTYAVRGLRQYWTPTIAGTSGSGSITYSSRGGVFWYDGSNLNLTFNISVSASSGFSGALAVQGLPLTQNTGANDMTSCVIGSMSGITLSTNYTNLTGLVSSGLNQVLLIENGSGQSSIPAPVSVAGSAFTINGTCVIAAGN